MAKTCKRYPLGLVWTEQLEYIILCFRLFHPTFFLAFSLLLLLAAGCCWCCWLLATGCCCCCFCCCCWGSLSSMAVSFSIIKRTAMQDSLSQGCLENSQPCSWQPCKIACARNVRKAHSHAGWAAQTQAILHGCNFPSMSGTACPAWLWALSWMAVSFSSMSGTAWRWNISGAAYPAWLRAFQSSLGQPILHGCELFNHLWESLSCMAVSFSSISGKGYPAWLSALQACTKTKILPKAGEINFFH